MAIHKTAGARLFISPTVALPDTINAMSDVDALAYFEALVDWIEIEEVEEYGEIGDSSEEINFTAVGNRRVRKLKGPRNAGTQAVVVGRDPLDDGQVQLIAAEATDFNYPIRIELDDARSVNHSKSTLYYAGLVMSKPTGLANVSSVTRRTFNIGINTAVYEVASANLVAPVNALLPSVSGVAQDGQVLTAIEGLWNNDPTSFSYQWQADALGNGTYADIGGATAKTYTLATDQVGDSVRVIVTATNAAGSTPANSAGTALVAA
ncbi:hypothetical protein [Pelagibius sp.]|uniref:hypothetical protein n=1 Tax=Pelagibius sp. TaxID=1931238 RepID=UPI003BAE4425